MSDNWTSLRQHRAAQGETRITDLFDADPARATGFSASADGMVFDYSKTLIDRTGRDLLIALAERANVAARREAMFAGEKINETEGRAVLHLSLIYI